MTGTAPSADALARQALQSYQQGRYVEAAEAFGAVRRAHEAQGDLLAAAEAANNQCVALLKAERPREALAAVQGTPETFTKAGNRPRAAQATGNLGSALEACGDLREAETAFRRSLDLFRELGDADGQAVILESLSQVQLRLGRPLEALASMEAGLGGKPKLRLRDRILQGLLRLPGRLMGR